MKRRQRAGAYGRPREYLGRRVTHWTLLIIGVAFLGLGVHYMIHGFRMIEAAPPGQSGSLPTLFGAAFLTFFGSLAAAGFLLDPDEDFDDRAPKAVTIAFNSMIAITLAVAIHSTTHSRPASIGAGFLIFFGSLALLGFRLPMAIMIACYIVAGTFLVGVIAITTQ